MCRRQVVAGQIYVVVSAQSRIYNIEMEKIPAVDCVINIKMTILPLMSLRVGPSAKQCDEKGSCVRLR